jgi:peptidoglycan/xylan/chitin deacetylase (PgdA/CDA1 family)
MRRFGLLSMAFAAAVVVGGVATTAAAASRPLRLEAGPQTGYTFSSTGAILASKTVSLAKPANVATDDRRSIAGRGVYLRVTSGSLTGYYVRESPVAYVPGRVITASYPTPANVTFGPGTYLGYRFDASWRLAATKKAVVATAATAKASARSMINGRAYAAIASGTWDGYWIPVVSPTTLAASAISCASPAKIPPGAAHVYRALPAGSSAIALTFDMGGRLDPGLDIVRRLIVDRVCTTFFPTGAMTATSAGKAILALIGAHPELFELGNHTNHHCNLRDGGGGSPTTAACPTTPPSARFIATELKAAAAVLKSASAGMEPAPYWRPPYGAYDSRVVAAAAAAGYTKTVLWSIDAIDWRPVSEGGPTAAQIADKVVANAVDGSDVLMHLGGWNTLDALPSMVTRLRALGLKPSTISAILH